MGLIIGVIILFEAKAKGTPKGFFISNEKRDTGGLMTTLYIDDVRYKI